MLRGSFAMETPEVRLGKMKFDGFGVFDLHGLALQPQGQE